MIKFFWFISIKLLFVSLTLVAYSDNLPLCKKMEAVGKQDYSLLKPDEMWFLSICYETNTLETNKLDRNKLIVLWTTLSADEGYAPSQHNLAGFYEEGNYIPKDIKKAIKYYKMSAEQVYPPSMVSLAFLNAEGNGMLKDYIKAHMWSNIAAAIGKKESVVKYAIKIRTYVEARMNSDDISKAITSAKKCMNSDYKNC